MPSRIDFEPAAACCQPEDIHHTAFVVEEAGAALRLRETRLVEVEELHDTNSVEKELSSGAAAQTVENVTYLQRALVAKSLVDVVAVLPEGKIPVAGAATAAQMGAGSALVEDKTMAVASGPDVEK